MYVRKHYFYRTTRGSLWTAHRTDRDRTCERVELGLRAADALWKANKADSRTRTIRTSDKSDTGPCGPEDRGKPGRRFRLSL